MQPTRLITSVLLATALSGCLHVQVFGPVAGATVTIAPIRDRDNIVYQGETLDRDAVIALVGEEAWGGYNALLKLVWMGILNDPALDELDDDRVYLVIATGGVDEDVDNDLLIDDSGTPVGASLHAVLTGAQIKGGDGKVSVITELLYQAMDPSTFDNHGQSWFVDEQDMLADRLVPDITEDGTIDFSDVLAWSRLTTADRFMGNPDMLAAFSQALLDGGDQAALSSMAQQITGTAVDLSHELAGTWQLSIDEGELACSDGSISDLDAIELEVTVSITGDSMSLPNSEWSSVQDWTITGDSGISGSFDEGNFALFQTLTGIPGVNPDLGEQQINVSYFGQFDGESWSGQYLYDFDIVGFDFSCESEQDFRGGKLD